MCKKYLRITWAIINPSKIRIEINAYHVAKILINLLIVKYSNLFKKDYKLMKKRGLNLALLHEVVSMLANNESLPDKYKDHYLIGEYKRI